jgi:PD-(D/E)XK nuclease superfamily
MTKKTFVPKTRTHISPSDLTFTYGECKRCFWLKYNKGISTPGFMPLVGPMSAFQEAAYRGLVSTSLDKQLLPGKISRYGEPVESMPIRVNGEETNWRIKGKYDLVVEYENGTVGLIDCKVTTGEMDDGKVSHYLPQLEAYCYALENPMTGQQEKVAHSGLMMWKIDNATQDEEDNNYFTTESAFLMVPRDPDGFQEFISGVIEVLEGPIPESGQKCNNCSYFEKRKLVDLNG